jgi:AraC-like DNA-binding protein
MNYLETPPSPRLIRYIESVWRLEASEKPSSQAAERILPDGCTELIFNLADPFKRYHADGTVEIQPKMLIVGQMRGYATIAPAGRVKLFGIRFRPGGAYPFLRLPLHELTDKIINAETVWNHLGKELEEKVHLAGSFRERIRIVESALMKRLDERYNGEKPVEELVKRILLTEGCYNIDRLIKDIGISSRQLERKFQTMVGIGPKLLARIVRFQKVFKAVEQQSDNWISVALECGYYDQAHLIRDFKTFSGQNPSAFFAHPHEMSEHFMRKNRTSDFYKTGI